MCSGKGSVDALPRPKLNLQSSYAITKLVGGRQGQARMSHARSDMLPF